MFDIGFSEIFVIAIVALLVLGPERLPKAARFAGLWVRRARAQWHSVKSELENELAAEELKRSLHETQESLREAQQGFNEGLDEARNRIKREQESLQRELDALDRDVRGSAAQSGAAAAAASELSSESVPESPALPADIEERALASTSDPDVSSRDEAIEPGVSGDDVYARGLPVETDSEREPTPVARPNPFARDDGAPQR
ncbi:Sec-independent protein translocase protein TatB [Lysobacter arvi]|uniref:Sec-independent protein translocase protein TatB n=1 Tax=Lysobacter arvi TaxID=3038776 RepID=A0ABU1CHW2_9GAMM|nr:Sec-independent protein translocase protein TatB [Lysobacter arvi]MDR0184543.1 Sec-independent protein translocase protein TatB [Lysobacter arvi]